MPTDVVVAALRAFIEERGWDQFRSPANLAKAVAVQAGELVECFQEGATGDTARVEAELADVLVYCLLLAERLGLDVDELIRAKLEHDLGGAPGTSAG